MSTEQNQTSQGQALQEQALVKKQSSALWTIRQKPELITVPASIVVFLGLWELITRGLDIPTYILPAPSLIWRAFISGWQSGIFGYHTLVTLKEVVIGFGIAIILGIVLGSLVAQWRLVEKTIYPYLIAIETIPKIALAPIIIVWVGLGIESKITIAALVAFFPILVNTIEGLVMVEELKLDLMRSLGANQWQIFWKLRVPNALPLIFTGLETASVLCVLGAITCEFVGSKAGLGSLILQYQFLLEIPSFFGVVLILCALGLLFNGMIGFLKRRIVFWVKHTGSENTLETTTSM